ncbi:hypothetical protein M422DRAFT_265865 [Sphaerobolus stellatus SS14]|uniref:Nucleolar protein 9 n=1 Tax=Sphaerobolus stellatus (strain SS14) TaxID=990650 RepID=A0A0C9TQI1_SPHS4|nr:hypothetical protein M422DRAFT_265865 [Sphaerobolus stellatus SS14]
MPRENRKRGKKNKKQEKEEVTTYAVEEPQYEEQVPYNQWEQQNEDELEAQAQVEEAPFGIVDPDVKAYFRTVNDQLKEWQDEGVDTEVDAEVDANEERRLFFKAALTEMNGKELQLSADPDCSPILERMLYSMDDFVRRVFADALAGSWIDLSKDRFASHVCQTLLALAADTISRETRGMLPPAPEGPDRGELLTMTELVLKACEDIITEVPMLMQNQFASHVLRELLLLLAPAQVSGHRDDRHAPTARSKKSAGWKARQGTMKAVIKDDQAANGKDSAVKRTPKSFMEMAKKFLDSLRSSSDPNELRALAVDKVASPVLQMFLEMETGFKQADAPGSILDSVLAGLISEGDSHTQASSYVSSLLLDATSSHLAESILTKCPRRVFDLLWPRYFVSELGKLSAHPVANFVVAKGIVRLDKEQLTEALQLLEGSWKKSLKAQRLGVLTASIERAAKINACEESLIKVIYSIFEIPQDEPGMIVPCVLRLKTLPDYQEVSERKREGEANPNGDKAEASVHHTRRQFRQEDPLEPKIQGSLLLQAILRLQAPHNEVILESLHAMKQEELLVIACSPIGSRVLDAALESSSIHIRLRKRLVTAFIGLFHQMADDRIGSRVAERCWDAADPYLKEKIAKSLLPHEQFLVGSHFGRFFARNLGLPLYKRNPDQWKATRAQQHKAVASSSNAISTFASGPESEAKSSQKRKRKDPEEEEGDIDRLFSGIGKYKHAQVGEPRPKKPVAELETTVLNAIKAAPDSQPSKKKKK